MNAQQAKKLDLRATELARQFKGYEDSLIECVNIVARMYKDQAWRLLSEQFQSFEDWFENRFHGSHATAYQMVRIGKVISHVKGGAQLVKELGVSKAEQAERIIRATGKLTQSDRQELRQASTGQAREYTNKRIGMQSQATRYFSGFQATPADYKRIIEGMQLAEKLGHKSRGAQVAALADAYLAQPKSVIGYKAESTSRARLSA